MYMVFLILDLYCYL